MDCAGRKLQLGCETSVLHSDHDKERIALAAVARAAVEEHTAQLREHQGQTEEDSGAAVATAADSTETVEERQHQHRSWVLLHGDQELPSHIHNWHRRLVVEDQTMAMAVLDQQAVEAVHMPAAEHLAPYRGSCASSTAAIQEERF